MILVNLNAIKNEIVLPTDAHKQIRFGQISRMIDIKSNLNINEAAEIEDKAYFV
jgi:hypothetical protein